MKVAAASVSFRHEYFLLIKKAMAELGEAKPEEREEIKTIPICEKKLWRKYRNLVWKITEKQNLRKLPNYEKRAFTGYHLDHKVSIWYGYKNKLAPELIGGIDNLEFIPYKENMLKATKSNFKNAKCLQTVLFV